MFLDFGHFGIFLYNFFIFQYLMGLPLILIMILLVWSPIIAFALINTIGNISPPESAIMTVSLEGFPVNNFFFDFFFKFFWKLKKILSKKIQKNFPNFSSHSIKWKQKV